MTKSQSFSDAILADRAVREVNARMKIAQIIRDENLTNTQAVDLFARMTADYAKLLVIAEERVAVERLDDDVQAAVLKRAQVYLTPNVRR